MSFRVKRKSHLSKLSRCSRSRMWVLLLQTPEKCLEFQMQSHEYHECLFYSLNGSAQRKALKKKVEIAAIKWQAARNLRAHTLTQYLKSKGRAPSQDSASPPTIQPISLKVSTFRHATLFLPHSGVIVQMDQVQTDCSSW